MGWVDGGGLSPTLTLGHVHWPAIKPISMGFGLSIPTLDRVYIGRRSLN